MAELKKLPIGIEDFEKIRQEDFYYVDKTRLIEQLLAQWGEVNLFTRPRRFGKSLNMMQIEEQKFNNEIFQKMLRSILPYPGRMTSIFILQFLDNVFYFIR